MVYGDDNLYRSGGEVPALGHIPAGDGLSDKTAVTIYDHSQQRQGKDYSDIPVVLKGGSKSHFRLVVKRSNGGHSYTRKPT